MGRHTVISTIGIVDDDQNELPSGATGEIAVKGPMVSEGYYLSPEETARVRKTCASTQLRRETSQKVLLAAYEQIVARDETTHRTAKAIQRRRNTRRVIGDVG